MIRKLLLALIASAAVSVPPTIAADVAPPEEPVAEWTGFYIGAGAGYAWADLEVDLEQDPPADPGEINSADLDADNFLGTIQVGFDWQFSENFLVGIMGDWAFANLDDEESNPVCYVPACNPGDPFQGQIFKAGVDDMVTVSGRFGALLTPSVLAYALVGWTWASIDNAYFEGCEGIVPCDNIDYDEDDTADGLTVGGGFEVLLTKNVSGRIEYRFTHLDEVDHGEGSAEGCCTAKTRVDSEVHSIRATLNVRFKLF